MSPGPPRVRCRLSCYIRSYPAPPSALGDLDPGRPGPRSRAGQARSQRPAPGVRGGLADAPGNAPGSLLEPIKRNETISCQFHHCYLLVCVCACMCLCGVCECLSVRNFMLPSFFSFTSSPARSPWSAAPFLGSSDQGCGARLILIFLRDNPNP